jgi:hypothetical protein
VSVFSAPSAENQQTADIGQMPEFRNEFAVSAKYMKNNTLPEQIIFSNFHMGLAQHLLYSVLVLQ